MIKEKTFVDFLKTIVQKHPQETMMMFGPVDASPESGQPKVHPDSYALELFPNLSLDDTREFDRAALGLQAFYEALTGNEHWNINSDLKQKISNWTKDLVKTQEDLDGLSYSILFNDLGKLHTSTQRHEEIFGIQAADHDANMADILEKDPDFYPTFKKLSTQYQDGLLQGLKSGLNLGKCVRLECPDSAWDKFRALPKFSQDIHLCHSFFDFLGVSGAGNPRQFAPFIMNDKNIQSFEETMVIRDPVAYGQKRLGLLNITTEPLVIQEPQAIARLMCMATVFEHEAAHKLLRVLGTLSQKKQAVLWTELKIRGTEQEPAIELQYSPALMTHVLAESDIILKKTLLTMIELFIQARDSIKTLQLEGGKIEPFYILNMVELVTELKNTKSVPELTQGTLMPLMGGWRWIKNKPVQEN